jgi:protein tyrosine phosphatase (PTP) superfamily phosphohydrolase (DUF442 family)
MLTPPTGRRHPTRNALVDRSLYDPGMGEFTPPDDLLFNRAPVPDPEAYAQEVGCASWLYLVGPEFAEMDGGTTYAQVEAAVPVSQNVISDPPRVLDLDLARQHVAALDELPRPTLVTCRAGPRASAVVYMYAGLKSGASPEDVIAAVERDGVSCAASDEYKAWIADSITALRSDS